MTSPRYRMIAIDLDGTLLSPAGTVTPRTRAAVRSAIDAGYLVCFATGRSLRESEMILDSVGHRSAAVFVTGAMVVDTSAGTVLHRKLMHAKLARELCAFLEERGQTVLALQDWQQAGLDYLVTEGTPLNAATKKWVEVTESKVHRRNDLSTHDHSLTLRVSLVSGPGEVERCHRDLIEHFGDRVFCQNLIVPSWSMQVLELFDPSVNKWEGIMHVARKHGILPEEIVAVGDDANDIPMLSRAALGVAMGNARAEVQAKAHRVIGTNADDGLALFLEELIGK
jgi:Cof subfamily protein (haloacid dehalogenase superfamily)